MNVINSPLFCLTCDTDWASDYAIQDYLSLLTRFGVKSTVFATNGSPVIAESETRGEIEVGIHPNFLPDSTHGRDFASVIENLLGDFPNARTFRSHHFFDNSIITQLMLSRGLKYDSNICLYLQPNLIPLNHWSGLIRFPVFWEDDVHWTRTGGDWDFDKYLHHFLSPGLKILNFHPFFVAANIPNHDYYMEVKKHITTIDEGTIEQIRYKGEGTRTFLLRLLETLTSRGERFYPLEALYDMLSIEQFLLPSSETQGRHDPATEDEYQRYWRMGDAEKQEFIRQTFDRRNPTDPYATSRDGYLRELEIASIKSCLDEKGKLLDLGCGNGYTLISLAKDLSGWEMVGVDFSENMIQGANAVRDEQLPNLQSHPQFLAADAIEYVKSLADNSVDYVLTERFLQNMPSVSIQRSILHDVYRILAPGRRLLMCEGSEDGFEALNDVREASGLNRVPATSPDNASAIRFRESEIEEFAQQVGFRLRDKLGYSTYFTITRVLHPLLVAPQKPQFDARINELAMQLQKTLPYQPGIGSNVLWVFEKLI